MLTRLVHSSKMELAATLNSKTIGVDKWLLSYLLCEVITKGRRKKKENKKGVLSGDAPRAKETAE